MTAPQPLTDDVLRRVDARLDEQRCPGATTAADTGMQHCAECCYGTGFAAQTQAELDDLYLFRDLRAAVLAARAERDALRTAAEYPERTAGFLQGYCEGWADAKAGRQYGVGPYGQRSARAALDSTSEADQ